MWFGLGVSAQTTFVKCVDDYSKGGVNFRISYLDTLVEGSFEGVSIRIDSKVKAKIESDGYKTVFRQLRPATNYLIELLVEDVTLPSVVVTDVHRKSNRENTVLNITTIRSQEIEAMGAVDLKDILSFQNNIRLSRDQAIGASGMSLMGIGGNNVKLLVDGTPVIGRLFDQIDIEQFNTENIEQVEMIKGPMSVIYGSNALAGTINLISNKTSIKKASLRSYYESDGQYNLTGNIKIPFGKKTVEESKHFLAFSGGRLLFDGFTTTDDRSFDWIPKEQYNGRLVYNYSGAVKIRTRIEGLSSLLLDRGVPLAPYGESAIDQKYRNKRYDSEINIEKEWAASSIRLLLSNNDFTRIKNKYYKNLITLEENLIPIAQEQDTQRFNASVARLLYNTDYKGIETVVGFDGNYEIGKGNRITDGEQEQMDLAIFVSSEKELISGLKLRLGLRYAQNSAFNAPMVYSLQSRYRMRKSQSIKFSYGKGFRAPSLKELYLDLNDSRHEVFGNADLQPETSHSFLAVYQKYWTVKDWAFPTEIEGFYNHIENKIELIVTGPIQAKYGNIGIFETTGFTVTQGLRNENISAKISGSYTGIYNGIDGQTKSFNWSPQGTMNVSYKSPWFTANGFVNYFGKFTRVFSDSDSANLNVLEQDAYTTIDLSISKKLMNDRLSMSAGARNLLNVNQVNATTTEVGAHTPSTSFVAISPGRTYFLSIRYEFFK